MNCPVYLEDLLGCNVDVVTEDGLRDRIRTRVLLSISLKRFDSFLSNFFPFLFFPGLDGPGL
jgi:hypothetical protein